MLSFREFIAETPLGQKQSRDTSVFWKDAHTRKHLNTTYAANKLDTNEEAKILKDLRTKGGQMIASPKMIEHIKSKGIDIPQPGDSVFVGRSGDSTFHVALVHTPDGKFMLKGVQ